MVSEGWISDVKKAELKVKEINSQILALISERARLQKWISQKYAIRKIQEEKIKEYQETHPVIKR